MINLTVVIDNNEAIRKLRELQKTAKTTTSSIVTDAERMDAVWRKFSGAMKSAVAGVSFGALVRQVVNVRGEVQQLQVAFETMLGSKEKAEQVMAEAIELAAKTPFGLQDVSNATKMLLAYGSTAEDVMGEIKMLGNIASGLSIPLNDMIYLYGTTRTQGRMFTQDLRQFMGRGIPLAEELAKQFGVTKDKVGELVTAGKVGFPEMQKALEAMTSEGGKFYNLMDKQSQTITGQISNLEDQIYQMFNAIGESSEGVISDVISGASFIVEHYEEVLNILKYLVVAWGIYKAALITAAAYQKAMALLAFTGNLYKAAKGVTTLTAAVKALNVATKSNPIGLLLSGVALLATALWDFNDDVEETTESIGELEQAERDEYVQVQKLAYMLKDVNTKEEDRRRILEELKDINPSIVEGLDAEALSVETLTKNVNAYCEAQLKAIQLASMSDKMHDLLKTKADAEAEAALLEKAIVEQAADYALKEGYGVLRTQGPNHGQKELHAAYDAIKNRYKEDNDALGFAQRLSYLQGRTYNGATTLKGTDLGDKYRQLEAYRKAVADADAAIKDFGEDAQFIIDKLGLGTDTSAEDVKTYTQAVKEARIELAASKKDLAALLNDPNASDAAVKSAKERVATAEKTAKEYDIISTSNGGKDPAKEAKELIKLQQQLENDAAQARIDAMAEGAIKQRAQAELDFELRKQQIVAQEEELKKMQGGKITEEQTTYFGALNTANEKDRAKKIADINKPQEEAMREHLIAYGTFLEKKQALAEKYDKSIADAETAGDMAKAATLKRQRIEEEAAYYDEVVQFSETIKDYTLVQLENTIASMEELLDEQEEALAAMPSSQTDAYLAAVKQVETLKKKIAELTKAQDKKQKSANRDAKTQEKQTKKTQEFLGLLSQSADIFHQAGDAISEFNEPLGEAFSFIGDMVGASYTLISTISSVTSVASASAAALSTMEKASVILTAISVGLQLIQTLLQFITFDKEAEEYDRLTRRYEGLNEMWDELIAKKKEYLEMSWGQEAKAVSKEILDLIDAQIEANKNLAKEYMDVRKNQREVGKNMSWEGYKELEGLGLAKGIGGESLFYGESNRNRAKSIDWNSILNMSAEQLEELRRNAQIFWNELPDEMRGYLDAIIEGEAEAADVIAQLNEQLTGISFDDVFSGFFDTMSDMESTAEDVADNIAEYFFNAMLFNNLGNRYRDEIQEWYNDFAAFMANKDQLSEEEQRQQIEELRKRYQDMAEEAMAERDAIAEASGYDAGVESQEATSRGFNAMSQDTGDELNGRFTDIQGKVSGINEAVQYIKSINIEQAQHTQSISQTVAMIHNDTSLIEKHTRVLADIDDKLATISKNTENL